MKKIKWWGWILISIGILAAAFTLIMFFDGFKNNKLDENNLPKFIQADFIDLSQIYSISKFRSGSGHDFADGKETCRSMKHYFNVQFSEEGERLRNKNNGSPPPPDGKNDIKIYSPVDGEIIAIKSEQSPIGQQIYIEPDKYPEFAIRLFHIYKLDGVAKGKKVKAGEQIGVIGQYQNTDIAVETRVGSSYRLFSYFQVMQDEIFAKYQARGVSSRDEFIITKEERDASPLACRGEWFATSIDDGANQDHFVRLSGWKNDY